MSSMTNAEVEESGNDDAEISDVAKPDAEKIEEIKDDAKKAELPPTSSSLSVSLGFGDQFLKKSSDTSLIGTFLSVLTIPVLVISDPSVITPLQETPSTALVTSLPPPSISTIPSVPHQSSTPIPTPAITNDAPTITTTILESDAFFAVQLRVAKLKKDVFELKKIDHFAEALATLKSQVPTVVDNYLGSKLDDSLYKKSASEIRMIKKEQAEKQKMPKYTIKSTAKATLKEYDQKSALYQTMHENKSFNKNPTNHALYHALMEALIEDENAMDKGVADIGKKTKKRRTKESESAKKPSTTKETSKCKALLKGSKTGKSATAKEPVEEPIAEVVIDDAVNTAGEDVVRDDDHLKILHNPRQIRLQNKIGSNNLQGLLLLIRNETSIKLYLINLNSRLVEPRLFRLIKYNLMLVSFQIRSRRPWFNQMVGTYKLDLNNLEGDRYSSDLSKPLPLQGCLDHLTVAANCFFNNDLDFLKTSDLEKTYTTSIMKTKDARYEIKGIEDMVPTLWSPTKVGYNKDVLKGIKHWGDRRKLWYKSQVNKFSKHNVYSTQKILGVKSVSVKKLHGYGHVEEIVVKRADRQLYKFKEGNFVDLHLNEIEEMMLLAVQHKLFYLNDNDIVDFIVALRMFKRSRIIKRRFEDLQLGVDSYQKKLNCTSKDLS
ncbi:hypothetical protein Tco_0979930 [Tanacetum coccineum]